MNGVKYTIVGTKGGSVYAHDNSHRKIEYAQSSGKMYKHDDHRNFNSD